jgi:hypothetical protein
MTDLYLHNQRLESIFELLGVTENAITYSIGWALSNSPAFLRAMVLRLFPDAGSAAVKEIHLQEHEGKGGITDVEIIGSSVHIIIEAKRGWSLPDQTQLKLYSERLKGSSQYSALVAMAECSPEYARLHLPEVVNGFPVLYLSWRDIDRLSQVSYGTHSEKRLLEQLRVYLRRIVRMQDQESNIVYVVSLGNRSWEQSKLSWRDIVNKKCRYFHPVGGGKGGWRRAPPNYMGFRYGGKLQSIHHVESWKIVEELHTDIPEIEPRAINVPYFLYVLGEPIVPAKDVRNGKIWPNGRYEIMIDLLLTSKTIREARDLTQRRLSEAQ